MMYRISEVVAGNFHGVLLLDINTKLKIKLVYVCTVKHRSYSKVLGINYFDSLYDNEKFYIQ